MRGVERRYKLQPYGCIGVGHQVIRREDDMDASTDQSGVNRLKKLEILTNICVILVAVATLIVLVSRSRGGGVGQQRVFRPGDQVKISGISWDTASANVLIAMQIGCHWCEASAGFYKRMVNSKNNGVRLLAVFPQAESISRAYLSSLGVAIDEVHQADFSQLGITGTPTIMIVDSQGKLGASWQGKLSTAQEDDLLGRLARVGANSAGRPSESLPMSSGVITYASLSDVLESSRSENSTATILDVRTRDDFKRGHITHSYNIPWDELSARARHEISGEERILLYCRYCAPCELKSATNGTATFCTMTYSRLKKLTFSHIAIIDQDLAHLRLKGVMVDGSTIETPSTSRGSSIAFKLPFPIPHAPESEAQ